jgi:hypothetical protein
VSAFPRARSWGLLFFLSLFFPFVPEVRVRFSETLRAHRCPGGAGPFLCRFADDASRRPAGIVLGPSFFFPSVISFVFSNQREMTGMCDFAVEYFGRKGNLFVGSACASCGAERWSALHCSGPSQTGSLSDANRICYFFRVVSTKEL